MSYVSVQLICASIVEDLVSYVGSGFADVSAHLAHNADMLITVE